MSNGTSARQDHANYIYSIAPDVCWTPMGSKKVPVAYNTIAFLDKSTRTSQSVRNNGVADFQLNTRTTTCVGHEHGTGKGVKSGGYKQYSVVRQGSSSVFSEGWAVIRDNDPAWINRPDPGPVEPRRPDSELDVEYRNFIV